MKKWIVILLLFFASVSWAEVDLDGTNDYLNCGSHDSIDSLLRDGDITVTAWINFDTYGGGANNRSYIYGAASDFTSGNGFWVFWIDDSAADDQLELLVDGTSGDGTWTASNDISEGNQYHVAFTYNGTNQANDPVLYVNGSSVTLDTDTNPVGVTGTAAAQTYCIGGRTTDSARNFDGRVNSVCLWNTQLTATQIKSIYDSKVKRFELQVAPSNLVECWFLDDIADGASGSGSTYKSWSGLNNCTGTNGSVGKAETYLTYP